MSGIGLSTITSVIDNKKLTPKHPPKPNINLALKECGFGWFQIRVLFASFFGISLTTTITNSISYILPNAECDLDMDLQMKGILNAMFFTGSIISSIVAGFLVDTFGRKPFLIIGLSLFTFFNLVSAMSQTYNMLLVSKFCEGLVFSLSYGPMLSYTAEFCHDGIRDRVFLAQAAFAPISQVLFAGFSWAILVNDWQLNLFGGYFVLHTWNVFLLIIAIFPLIACILYSFLPESPKYLLAKTRYDEARKVLCYVYRINTGKSIESFTYFNKWKDSSVIRQGENPRITLGHQLTVGLHNVKLLFRKPLLNYILLFSTMIFFVMLLFNWIRMWYPQLSTIVEHYATEDNQELCTVLDAYLHDLRLKTTNLTSAENCVPVKSGTETYMNNVILGGSSVPSYILTALLVNRIGKKYLLIATGFINIGVTLGLRWSNSKIQVVTLFAAGMAVSQVMKSLLEASSMQFFPTSIRTLALSVMMTTGRLGSLAGNIVFPILLDISVVIPFYSLTGFMVVVTILAMLQPTKKK